jgi:hypothetical protein
VVLPRLTPRGGRARVRLANVAPEVEHLDQALLGVVAVGPGEELDLDAAGRPFRWKPDREVAVGGGEKCIRLGGFTLPLGGAAPGHVLVLEARNTSAFEAAMRGHLLAGGPAPDAAIRARFDRGKAARVSPVGTKFLRRVVLPVPPEAATVRLEIPENYWLVPRLWMGTGADVLAEVRWLLPDAGPAEAKAAAALARRDGKRIRLGPGEVIELEFSAADDLPGPAGRGYVFRLVGYYEFLPHGPGAGFPAR